MRSLLDVRTRLGAWWLGWVAVARPALTAWVEWAGWPAAVLALAPPLAVSLLFVARLAEWPVLSGLAFRLLGLALLLGCLAATLVARWLNWPGQLASLSTAVTLGLVVPSLVIHLPLARRAVVDPVPVVIAPAFASLALLTGTIVAVVGVVLVCRPAPPLVGPCLLPAASLAVWPLLLVWRLEEAIVWAMLAFTFALAAVVWLLAGLARGWLIVLPPLVGLGATYAVALSLMTPGVVSPRVSGLLDAHLALALTTSLLVVLLPVGLAGWRAWRGRAG